MTDFEELHENEQFAQDGYLQNQSSSVPECMSTGAHCYCTHTTGGLPMCCRCGAIKLTRRSPEDTRKYIYDHIFITSDLDPEVFRGIAEQVSVIDEIEPLPVPAMPEDLYEALYNPLHPLPPSLLKRLLQKLKICDG